MAIVVGAGIAAVGTVAAASSASDATKSAANQAANSQQNTLAMQQQQLQAQIALQQQALNQQTALSAPYRSFGESAIPQLSGMLGLSPQPVSTQPAPLNGLPAGYTANGLPQQAPQQGMGPLGGGGVPIAGVQSPQNAALSAHSLQALQYGQPPQAQQPVQLPGQQPGTTLNATQGPGGQYYVPPAPTTNGVPTYGGVLQGYQNLLGNIYQAEGLSPNGTMGANGPNTQAMTNALRNSPGYQFQLEEGNENVKNQAAAMGMGLSGNTLQGLQQFGQGLADSTYQQYLGNLGNTLGQYQGYVGDYQNYLGNLMNSLGVGQAAAAGQAANIGQSAASMGAAYQNAGAQSAAANNTLAGIYTNAGNTAAGISANEIAGLSRIGGNTLNQFTSQNTLNALNNPNGQSLYQGASPSYTGDPGTVDAGGGYTFTY